MTEIARSTREYSPAGKAVTNRFLWGQGYALENALLDAPHMTETGTTVSVFEQSLILEVPPLGTLMELINGCRVRLARELACGLFEAAIHSYDNKDFDGLGQAIVDWASTLELETDRNLVRRLRRRRASLSHDRSSAI